MMRLPVLPDEPPQHFSRADGSVYRRTGYCNRCGACCRAGNYFEEEGEIPGACKLYVERDGLGHCSDRADPYYQSACARWPSDPTCIADYPECSYVFERIR